MKLRRRHIVIALLIGVVLGVAYVAYSQMPHASTVTTGHFKLEVVHTREELERGLGGRTSIPHNYGMLFVFQNSDEYTFWMKDMLVPIDILWLANDGTILKIDANVSPSTYPDKTFSAPRPVRLVLELAAGEAERLGWKVGGKAPLPLD